MAKDYKTTGLQVNKIIASGSTGTNAKLLVYPVDAQDATQPNQGIIDNTKFDTSNIGDDVFLYVSGSEDAKTVFGGDVKVSGSLQVNAIETESGQPFIVAGDNITIEEGPEGELQISAQASYFYSEQQDLIQTSGSLVSSGSITAPALSGSLTTLANGDPYLVAGAAITIENNPNGSITIASEASYMYSPSANVVATSGSLQASGSITAPALSGSLTTLANGDPYLVAGAAITIENNPNGSITISADTGAIEAPGSTNEIAYNVAGALSASNKLWFNPGPGNLNVSGTINAPAFSGSLTRLINGDPYITTIGGVSISTGSNGGLILSGTNGVTLHSSLDGLDANDHPQYLLTSSFDTISGAIAQEIIDIKQDITDISSAIETDIGTLSNAISDLENTQYWTSPSSGQVQTTGSVSAPAFSGSLTTLANGDSYLVAGTAITITSNSNGSVTIAATPGATQAAGAEGQVQFNTGDVLDASTDLWTDGSSLHVSGVIRVAGGLSGSHTTLLDGTAFIVPEGGLSTATGSNGQITISSLALSQSIATDIGGINTSVSTLSGAVASDINGINNSISTLSGAVATDIEDIRGSIAGTSAWYVDGITVGTTSSVATTGSLLVKSGITGALNFLPDGNAFIVPEGGLSTSTGSNGQITISAFALSSSIATDINSTNTSVTALSNSVATNINTLSNSITTLSGVVATDVNSLNSMITTLSGAVATDVNSLNTRVTTLSGAVASDVITLDSRITSVSSALDNRITSVSSSIATNINTLSNSITTLSGVVATDVNNLNTRVTNISSSTAADIEDIRSTMAGSDAWFMDGLVVATTSSVGITGSLIVRSGITGALNRLPDGSASIVGSGGITTATGSNGQITIGFQDVGSYSSHRTFAGTELFLQNSDNNSLIYVSNSVDVDVRVPDTLDAGFRVDLIQQGLGRMLFSATGSLFHPSYFAPTSSQRYSATSINISGSNKDAYLSGDLELTALAPQASEIEFTPITNFTSSNVQDAIAEVNVMSASFATRITALSGAVATDVSNLDGRITSVSSALDNRITSVSSSIATDLFFFQSSGSGGTDITLTNDISGRVLFCTAASAVTVRVPTGLQNGFNTTIVQAGAGQITVLATASLLYPSTFSNKSAQQNSMIALVSGSSGLFLGGDLELA
jgi:hypothetical protein